MAQERQDNTVDECLHPSNVNYCRLYVDWITPKVYGRVCDLGSGIGYPTLKYAEKDNVSEVITNDKYYEEGKTIKHAKILRYVETTEDFLKRDLGQFDCITCTEHIEHLEMQTQLDLLNWVKKYLKDGGLFLGSMPNVDRSINPFHIQEYTHKQWHAILKRHFKHADVVLLNNDLYVWIAHN